MITRGRAKEHHEKLQKMIPDILLDYLTSPQIETLRKESERSYQTLLRSIAQQYIGNEAILDHVEQNILFPNDEGEYTLHLHEVDSPKNGDAALWKALTGNDLPDKSQTRHSSGARALALGVALTSLVAFSGGLYMMVSGASKESAVDVSTVLKGVDEKTLSEMQKDLQRLETITDRFSKIGATPKLNRENVFSTLEICIGYLRPRISKKVAINILASDKEINALLNPSLFNWVMENLIKNAVDAMEGSGEITITLTDLVQFVYIDVSDTGKGIPRNKQKTIFEPGYTTKQRGWGLGLSLTKRIIENYHNGKIFVKQSSSENGTTFRIVLNK